MMFRSNNYLLDLNTNSFLYLTRIENVKECIGKLLSCNWTPPKYVNRNVICIKYRKWWWLWNIRYTPLQMWGRSEGCPTLLLTLCKSSLVHTLAELCAECQLQHWMCSGGGGNTLAIQTTSICRPEGCPTFVASLLKLSRFDSSSLPVFSSVIGTLLYF